MSKRFDFDKLKKIKEDIKNGVEPSEEEKKEFKGREIEVEDDPESLLKGLVDLAISTVLSVYGKKADSKKLKTLRGKLEKLTVDDFYVNDKATELIREAFNLSISFASPEEDYESMDVNSLVDTLTNNTPIELLNRINILNYEMDSCINIYDRINSNILVGNFKIKNDNYLTSLPSVMLVNERSGFQVGDSSGLITLLVSFLNPAFYISNSSLNPEDSTKSFNCSLLSELNKIRITPTSKYFSLQNSYDLSVSKLIDILSSILFEWDKLPIDSEIDDIFNRDSKLDYPLIQLLEQLSKDKVYPNAKTFTTKLLSNILLICDNKEEIEDLLEEIDNDKTYISKISYMYQVWSMGYATNLPWSILESRDIAD